jgi:hypothetical protein
LKASNLPNGAAVLPQNKGVIKMKIKLAVAMSEDQSCFVAYNDFDNEETTMMRVNADLGLTGRVADRKFYVEVEIPTKIEAKPA